MPERYYKWKVGDEFAYVRVPPDYFYPYIIGSTLSRVVSIKLDDPGLISIDAEVFEQWNKKWKALMDWPA